MSEFQPAPTYAPLALQDEATKQFYINPVWLDFFLQMVQLLTESGGGGGAFDHNDLSSLQGGSASERFHLDSATYSILATDPGADRIIFWDTSANVIALLSVDSSLTLSGTTLSVTNTPAIGTPQATTSGTSKDFTVPTWATEVTFTFAGVSTNGSSVPILQLIDSGGSAVTSGYIGSVVNSDGSVSASYSSGFNLVGGIAAATVINGRYTMTKLTGSGTPKWAGSGLTGFSSSASVHDGGGSVSNANIATITGIRLTTAGGADTFDAGEANVRYS